MPTLYEYIEGELEDASLTVGDIQLVEWDTQNAEWGDAGWLPVHLQQFGTLAQSIQAAAVLPAARLRLRFTVELSPGIESRFQWDGTGFDVVPEDPGIVTLTSVDLTGV